MVVVGRMLPRKFTPCEAPRESSKVTMSPKMNLSAAEVPVFQKLLEAASQVALAAPLVQMSSPKPRAKVVLVAPTLKVGALR